MADDLTPALDADARRRKALEPVRAAKHACGVCGADDGTPHGCEHCQPADCTRAVAQYDGPADPDIDF